MNGDNGILGSVPGEFIIMASKGLPPAETCTSPTVHATIQAADLKPVVIRFVRQRMEHGRQSYWSWVAEHAAEVI